MEEKRFELICEVKEIQEDGTFQGIASVYGVEDLGGDIIDKGAFRKTISENSTVPILWQHKNDEVIGEGSVKEWQGKILVDAKLDLEDETGQKAYRKIKRKLIKGLSIGFQTVKSTWEEVEGRMIRHISELKLWEVSIVTFPMLPSAQINRVKSAEDADRIAALESQVSSLSARLDETQSTTPKGAEKTGEGAEGQTQTPVDDHSAADTAARGLLDILKRGINHG